MISCDEDLFANSDEEISVPSSQLSNPVEKYLKKQFINVQTKIETTTNDIEEVKATIRHILNILQRHMLYEGDIVSDTDSDLYTIEGEPVIKKKRYHRTNNIEKNLEIVSQWQCILHDKWIIGIELQNKLQCSLKKLRYYPCVKDELEICGQSMFWQLGEDRFWQRINAIHSGTAYVVATTILDLPGFARESVAECWGTISYEIDEMQLQTPVPLVQLSVTEIINCSWIKFLEKNKHGAILTLKSTSSMEKIVNVPLSNDLDEHDFEKKRLFCFLAKKAFEKIYGDVFSVREHGSLTDCLIEILSIDFDKASLKIFARSVNQLHIMLRLLQDEFPNMIIVEKVDNCIEAAMALIRELEMTRDKKNALEIQEAKLVTDLLIP